MQRMETAALVERARQGSSEELDALLGRCTPKLLALIRLRMGPQLRRSLESRDVLQNTLLKAFKGIDRFEGEGRESLMAWLARIAQNEIRDQADRQHAQMRDARREVPFDEIGEMAGPIRTATARVALGERARTLERALEAIEADHREIIVLRKLEELTFPEIAEQMGRTPDACRMLFSRAMAALTMKVGELR